MPSMQWRRRSSVQLFCTFYFCRVYYLCGFYDFCSFYYLFSLYNLSFYFFAKH